ncbi:MAG TPA: hypothetical protein VIM48_04165 [Chthoniobacterales bacterium]
MRPCQGEGGVLSVCDALPGGLGAFRHLAEKGPMSPLRGKEPAAGVRSKRLDHSKSLRKGSRCGGKAGMRDGSDEGDSHQY